MHRTLTMLWPCLGKPNSRDVHSAQLLEASSKYLGSGVRSKNIKLPEVETTPKAFEIACHSGAYHIIPQKLRKLCFLAPLPISLPTWSNQKFSCGSNARDTSGQHSRSSCSFLPCHMQWITMMAGHSSCSSRFFHNYVLVIHAFHSCS